MCKQTNKTEIILIKITNNLVLHNKINTKQTTSQLLGRRAGINVQKQRAASIEEFNSQDVNTGDNRLA